MSEEKKMGPGATLVATVIAFLVVTAVFYGLDHFIMSIQGLPLNMDLTPAS
ncbi:MAG: hypothetical protein GY703_10190 [Gammaproteobacteria bacterium]|nr:hypothetical protein [Gammaproteobacteria bacterium]